MNSITAIRQFVSPELRPLPLPPAGVPAPKATPVPLEELREVAPFLAPGTVQAPSESSTPFGTMLERLVREVNGKQNAAADTVRGLLSGQNVSLHQAMIAAEEANLSFQLMVEVRNKLLESYQELMRMQI
jgi:flagellar hook-basal body complex protein FliE